MIWKSYIEDKILSYMHSPDMMYTFLFTFLNSLTINIKLVKLNTNSNIVFFGIILSILVCSTYSVLYLLNVQQQTIPSTSKNICLI